MYPSDHWDRVKLVAEKLNADGCSGVPDLWFRLCCYDHDICYRTGKTAEDEPITRWEADKRFRQCMTTVSPVGRASPVSWLYWVGVRIFGGAAWNRAGGPQ